MSYNKIIWVNDETEVNAENMNHIENGIFDSYNITLLAVSDVEPTECEEGDKYYNTEDKVIYTATATDTWGNIGETPTSGILYVVFDEKNTYSWDGTDLVSVGGGSGSEIVIEPDEPTEDTKLIIEESDLDFQGLDYVEDVYSTSEVKTNKVWIDNKPIYRKVVQFNGLSGTTPNYISLGLSNINEIMPTTTVFLYDNTGIAYFANYNNVWNLQQDLGFYIDKPNNRAVVKQYADFGFTKGYVIVEYTKTTD